MGNKNACLKVFWEPIDWYLGTSVMGLYSKVRYFTADLRSGAPSLASLGNFVSHGVSFGWLKIYFPIKAIPKVSM